MTQLGTLDELPQDYRDAMTEAGVAPLWPMMRNVLPHDKPKPTTKPGYWAYDDAVRPLLLRAGELTPVEKAEEIKISLGATSNTVKVVSLAAEPMAPIKPRKKQNILIGGVPMGKMKNEGAFFVEYWEKSGKKRKG